MASRWPVWVRVTLWLLAADLLLFVPWVAVRGAQLVSGWGGGNVYFGHRPEYVFTGESIAEVGGRAVWWVPVDGMAGLGVVLPAMAAVLAVAAVVQRRMDRAQIRRCPEQKWLNRLSAGGCPECGYDLRATPEKRNVLVARCPECGCLVREGAAEREAAVGAKWAKIGELREGWVTVRFVEGAGVGE